MVCPPPHSDSTRQTRTSCCESRADDRSPSSTDGCQNTSRSTIHACGCIRQLVLCAFCLLFADSLCVLCVFARFFRYLAVGLYVGIGTVGGFIWWYLSSTNGPHISWEQLINFHSCESGANPTLYAGIDCAIFHDARPSTVSLSILVTIEMFNALNALSENQSLLTTPPTSNPYVLIACALSFALHFMIVYVPFFASIFHVAPLNQEEWLHVLYASFPVIVLDETLKFISRQVAGQRHTPTNTGMRTHTALAAMRCALSVCVLTLCFPLFSLPLWLLL